MKALLLSLMIFASATTLAEPSEGKVVPKDAIMMILCNGHKIAFVIGSDYSINEYEWSKELSAGLRAAIPDDHARLVKTEGCAEKPQADKPNPFDYEPNEGADPTKPEKGKVTELKDTRPAQCTTEWAEANHRLWDEGHCSNIEYQHTQYTPDGSKPMSPEHKAQRDIQGHQDELTGPHGHKWCDGHVAQIINYPDGSYLIQCMPAKLVQ